MHLISNLIEQSMIHLNTHQPIPFTVTDQVTIYTFLIFTLLYEYYFHRDEAYVLHSITEAHVYL